VIKFVAMFELSLLLMQQLFMLCRQSFCFVML